MTLEKESPCKVNLLLNILGKRADGFHALESVMHPVPFYDRLAFELCVASGVERSGCNQRKARIASGCLSTCRSAR